MEYHHDDGLTGNAATNIRGHYNAKALRKGLD